LPDDRFSFSDRFLPLPEFIGQHMRRLSGKDYSLVSIKRLVKNGTIPIVRIGNVQFVDLQRFAEKMANLPLYEPKKRQRVRLND
jgi:hypothetical protein